MAPSRVGPLGAGVPRHGCKPQGPLRSPEPAGQTSESVSSSLCCWEVVRPCSARPETPPARSCLWGPSPTLNLHRPSLANIHTLAHQMPRLGPPVPHCTANPTAPRDQSDPVLAWSSSQSGREGRPVQLQGAECTPEDFLLCGQWPHQEREGCTGRPPQPHGHLPPLQPGLPTPF